MTELALILMGISTGVSAVFSFLAVRLANKAQGEADACLQIAKDARAVSHVARSMVDTFQTDIAKVASLVNENSENFVASLTRLQGNLADVERRLTNVHDRETVLGTSTNRSPWTAQLAKTLGPK